ncbi:unnamed protein product [Blepharisma stoltei]|uniref:Uncharacterized protein n=1 Tax=Blepharisma stoltei TaxID=1481888 RepID=A0AAU9K8G0_9CILI|nr:unnamed protein product [Blepharisma stoltei]
MSIKNSPKEQIRSFTLSIPSTLNTKTLSELSTQASRSPELPMRKMSESINLPSLVTPRQRISSFDVSSMLLFNKKGFKGDNFLQTFLPSKAIGFLPYIYAQNGYEKTKEMYSSIFSIEPENFLPLQRKKSSLDIFAEFRESRTRGRPSKEDITHKNKSFDSL